MEFVTISSQSDNSTDSDVILSTQDFQEYLRTDDESHIFNQRSSNNRRKRAAPYNINQRRDNNDGPSTSDSSTSSNPGGIFMESEKSLKTRQAALLNLCEKYKKDITDYKESIKTLEETLKVAESEIAEIDEQIEQQAIEKRKQRRRSIRKAYIEKYAWAFTDDPCPVCLEMYQEVVCYTACKHVICIKCNCTIMTSSENCSEFRCPLCRTEITGYVKFDEKKLSGKRYNPTNMFRGIMS